MKKFLVFAAIFAFAFARPDGLLHGHDGHVSVSQNSLGTYKYNVHLKDSSRTEERFADGTVIGEYTLYDAHGVPQTFKYTAGKDGFRIIEGPLPVAPLPVAETPEVVAARLYLHPVVPVVPALPALPLVPAVPAVPDHLVPAVPDHLVLPVQDTPEVQAAKAQFFTTYNAALH